MNSCEMISLDKKRINGEEVEQILFAFNPRNFRFFCGIIPAAKERCLPHDQVDSSEDSETCRMDESRSVE